MATSVYIDDSNQSLLDNQGDLILEPTEQSPAGGNYNLLVATATILGLNPIITFDNDSVDLSSDKRNLAVYGDMRDLVIS